MENNKMKLPSTEAMVEITLAKYPNGVTWIGLQKELSLAYAIDISPRRKNLIKKHLKIFSDSGRLIHIRGRGLVGRFRLSAKALRESGNSAKITKDFNEIGKDLNAIQAGVNAKKSLRGRKNESKFQSDERSKTTRSLIKIKYRERSMSRSY